jgi:hypothetical protein
VALASGALFLLSRRSFVFRFACLLLAFARVSFLSLVFATFHACFLSLRLVWLSLDLGLLLVWQGVCAHTGVTLERVLVSVDDGIAMREVSLRSSYKLNPNTSEATQTSDCTFSTQIRSGHKNTLCEMPLLMILVMVIRWTNNMNNTTT